MKKDARPDGRGRLRAEEFQRGHRRSRRNRGVEGVIEGSDGVQPLLAAATNLNSKEGKGKKGKRRRAKGQNEKVKTLVNPKLTPKHTPSQSVKQRENA